MERAKTIGRWLSFLPAAFGGAWIAFIAVGFLYRLSMLWAGFDPAEGVGRACVEAATGLALGAGFVYVGSRVAPRRQREVALMLAGLALLLIGAALVPAIVALHYWALWQLGWCVLGAGAVVWQTLQGELFAPGS